MFLLQNLNEIEQANMDWTKKTAKSTFQIWMKSSMIKYP